MLRVPPFAIREVGKTKWVPESVYEGTYKHPAQLEREKVIKEAVRKGPKEKTRRPWNVPLPSMAR